MQSKMLKAIMDRVAISVDKVENNSGNSTLNLYEKKIFC